MSEQHNDVCIICQEHGTLQNYIVENKNCKCRYYYHETCFPPSRRKKCPMCAKEISDISIEIPAPSAPPAAASAPAPQPNQIPLLRSQPLNIHEHLATRKQIFKGCICGSLVLIAIVVVVFTLINEYGN